MPISDKKIRNIWKICFSFMSTFSGFPPITCRPSTTCKARLDQLALEPPSQRCNNLQRNRWSLWIAKNERNIQIDRPPVVQMLIYLAMQKVLNYLEWIFSIMATYFGIHTYLLYAINNLQGQARSIGIGITRLELDSQKITKGVFAL